MRTFFFVVAAVCGLVALGCGVSGAGAGGLASLSMGFISVLAARNERHGPLQPAPPRSRR